MTHATTIMLPDYSTLSVEENIERAAVEISALTLAEKMTSERSWEIAALASAATPTERGVIAAGTAVISVAQYAEESGWVASGRDTSSLGKMISTYRKWQGNGRVEGCSFWAHYEYRNKPDELLPNTSYNVAKTGKSPEAARAFVKTALETVPVETAVHVTAEFLDTDDAGDALEDDDDAAEHVLNAATRTVTRSKSARSTTDPVRESTVVLELIIVLGKLRDLAATNHTSVLVTEAKNLMRETLRIIDGIETASPEVVGEMISDLEAFLASQ